jgi:hypothetical protein
VAVLATSLVFAAGVAVAGVDDVCAGLDSGKIDVAEGVASVTVTTSGNEWITGYCVKAGSFNQGLGPVYVTLAEPTQTLVITHPSGKDISHYSYSTDTQYVGTASVGDSGTYCNTDGQTVTVSWSSGTVTATSWVSQEDADAKALTKANELAAADKAAKTAGMTEGACTVTYTGTASAGGSAFYCNVDKVTVTVTWGSGVVTATSAISQADADAKAAAKATDLANADKAAKTAGMTPGVCSGDVVYQGQATASGTLPYCAADGTTDIWISYSGSGAAESLISTEDATAKAQVIADQNAQADLIAKIPEGAKPGVCSPTETAVVEPATVAVPEAATVPMPATAPMPATVPAGDGSSAPTTPTAALVLLALGTLGLAVTAVRLATARRSG